LAHCRLFAKLDRIQAAVDSVAKFAKHWLALDILSSIGDPAKRIGACAGRAAAIVPGSEFTMAALRSLTNIQLLKVANIRSTDTLDAADTFAPDLGLSLATPILPLSECSANSNAAWQSGSIFRIDRNYRGRPPLPARHSAWQCLHSNDAMGPPARDARSGFTIGSHSMSHTDCAAERADIVRDELVQSAADLRRELGLGDVLFAYPLWWSEEYDATAVRAG
jgi:hypothetical protein